MNKLAQDNASKASGQTAKKGVALVGLCVVACKLPLLLALFGFGGVGATASILNLSPTAQLIAVAVGTLGIVATTAYFVYRMYRRSTR